MSALEELVTVANWNKIPKDLVWMGALSDYADITSAAAELTRLQAIEKAARDWLETDEEHVSDSDERLIVALLEKDVLE